MRLTICRPEILEEIRLLTNLETSQQKLLQIVLAGQPELDQTLDSHELRQLKQRIALRCHLEALSLDETRDYMSRRLQIAGAGASSQIFSEPAIEAVFRHSRGIPGSSTPSARTRLLAGYAKQAATIPAEIIDEVARDLRLGVVVAGTETERSPALKNQEPNELLLAVKTLLEIHDRMQDGKPYSKGRLQ
jgi:general secretion pathway protein A